MLSECKDPQMQRAALAGGPDRKANFNNADDSNTNQTGQAETALGAALRAALARKAAS